MTQEQQLGLAHSKRNLIRWAKELVRCAAASPPPSPYWIDPWIRCSPPTHTHPDLPSCPVLPLPDLTWRVASPPPCPALPCSPSPPFPATELAAEAAAAAQAAGPGHL